MKTRSNPNKFITKMISAKSSTNPESFIEFGRGRRIDWRYPMDTPKCKGEKADSLQIVAKLGRFSRITINSGEFTRLK